MIKRISLYKALPRTISLFFGVFVASYMWASLNAEFEIGRPSSTAAIGYIFIPVYLGIAALAGWAVGWVIKSKFKDKEPVTLKSYLLTVGGVALISIFGASSIGVNQVKQFEEFNSPKLLSNAGALRKEARDHDTAHLAKERENLIWDFQNQSIGQINWAGKTVQVEVSNSTNMKLVENGQKLVNYDVRNYSYITEVSALEYPGTSRTNDYLVILVRLRATSFRSIILIYDNNFQLMYEELIKRCGKTQYIGLLRENGGENLVSHICEPFALKRPNNGA